MIGSALVFLGMALQSSGKVLYGTLLTSVSTPLFVAIGITLTAGVFLTLVRLRLPTEGRFTLLLLNLWTAISYLLLLRAEAPAAGHIRFDRDRYGAADRHRSCRPPGAHLAARDPYARLSRHLLGCAVLAFAEIAATELHPAGVMVWTAIGASVVAGATSVLGLGASRRLAMSGWTSRSTLAHRFYLTIAVALVWLALYAPATSAPDNASLPGS